MKTLKIGVIYKVTYPNGKIYIGQDRTDDINYFGSADSFAIATDHPRYMRDSFTVTRELLATKRQVTIQAINALERKFIAKHRSNDPKVGYNRTGVARRRCTVTNPGVDNDR